MKMFVAVAVAVFDGLFCVFGSHFVMIAIWVTFTAIFGYFQTHKYISKEKKPQTPFCRE